jgi:hypothetical protein
MKRSLEWETKHDGKISVTTYLKELNQKSLIYLTACRAREKFVSLSAKARDTVGSGQGAVRADVIGGWSIWKGRFLRQRC